MQDETWFDKAKANARWIGDKSRAASKIFNLFGQKSTADVVADFEEGPPTKGQWYRMVDGANLGRIVDHSYCCGCSYFVSIPRDIFAWEQLWKCGCGKEYALKDWLEALAHTARQEKACVAAGLPARPTALELEMAGQLGKTIKVKTGPVDKDELKESYNRLPRRVTGATQKSGPRVIDPDDPKNGGSTGVYEYSGNQPGPDTLADMSFGDPFSHRQFGR